MRKIKVGIVGCGVIGQIHMQNTVNSRLGQLVAVCDMNPQAMAAAAAKFSVPKTYVSLTDLFADREVEAIVLAMPTNGRAQLGIQALQAGKHVMLEKPAGMNADEIRTLIQARGNLTVAGCSSRMHFLPSSQKAKELVGSGVIGNVRMIHCRAHAAAGKKPEKLPPLWRLKKDVNGGGFLLNWGCYDLDYFMDIMDWKVEPQVILARTWGLPEIYSGYVVSGAADAETYYTALINCAHGLSINMERGEYMPSHGQAAWQVVGDRGSLNLFMPPAENKKIVLDAADAAEGVKSQTVWEGSDSWDIAHAGPLNDFLAGIQEKRPPATDLERSLLLQKIFDGIYASARTNDAVKIS